MATYWCCASSHTFDDTVFSPKWVIVFTLGISQQAMAGQQSILVEFTK